MLLFLSISLLAVILIHIFLIDLKHEEERKNMTRVRDVWRVFCFMRNRNVLTKKVHCLPLLFSFLSHVRTFYLKKNSIWCEKFDQNCVSIRLIDYSEYVCLYSLTLSLFFFFSLTKSQCFKHVQFCTNPIKWKWARFQHLIIKGSMIRFYRT